MLRNHTSLLVTLATLGLAGCFWGAYTLQDEADVVVQGIEDGQFGRSMARYAGDADYFLDFAVGAPEKSKVFIYPDASKNGVDGELSLDEAYVFSGEDEGEAGWDITSGELVGSTWFTDLVIAAPSEENTRGRIYILSGGTLSGDIDAKAYATIVGEAAGDYAGWSLATGDINGDGKQDLIIGACGADNFDGRVYGVYSPISAGEHSLADADVMIRGPGGRTSFGCKVATSDLDDDGTDDIFITEYYGNHRNEDTEGAVWVVYEAEKGDHYITTMDHAALITGETRWGQLGHGLSGGGDVNGDGIDDLALGAPGVYCRYYAYRSGGLCHYTVPGKAYVVLGESGVRLKGENAIEDIYTAAREQKTDVGFGYSVSIRGDVDGDGIDDILVGNQSSHSAALFYCSSVIDDPSIKDGTADAAHAIFTSDENNYAGQFVFMDHWDIDGDGTDEMFIAAPQQAWEYSPDLGEASVFTVFGRLDK